MIPFINYGTKEVMIEARERVAQGIFVKYGITADDNPVNESKAVVLAQVIKNKNTTNKNK